ncbi:MAG: molybdopterin molybdenumtransferase MoeA, partial [Anaerolineales bacterium]
DKPVFCLPGGPPSNHMAFLQLALPGLHKLAGYSHPGLPKLPATMAESVTGQVDSTQFKHGRLLKEDYKLLFQPLKYQSRLQEMADLEAIACIPEGQVELPAGSTVWVQLL